MKLFLAIAALLFFRVPFAVAQDSKVLEALGSFPPCAVSMGSDFLLDYTDSCYS
jgi:hypothetical protein